MAENPGPSRLAQPLTLGALAAGLAIGLATAGLVQPSLYSPSTPDHLLPGAASQDAMTILVAALALACIPTLRRGASILWPVWIGLMGYLIYAYAIYAFERTYNPVFPGYIAVLGLALWSVLLSFVSGPALRVTCRDPARPPPRRLTAGYFATMAVMFAMLWFSILLPAMDTRVPPAGNAIFVQDLAFVLPLLAVTARLLWLGRPWGDLLAIPILVKMATLGLSVLGGTLLSPLYGLPVAATEIAIYAALGAIPLVFLPSFLRRLEPAG